MYLKTSIYDGYQFYSNEIQFLDDNTDYRQRSKLTIDNTKKL